MCHKRTVLSNDADRRKGSLVISSGACLLHDKSTTSARCSSNTATGSEEKSLISVPSGADPERRVIRFRVDGAACSDDSACPLPPSAESRSVCVYAMNFVYS